VEMVVVDTVAETETSAAVMAVATAVDTKSN
jgi:hypothetical protein